MKFFKYSLKKIKFSNKLVHILTFTIKIIYYNSLMI